MRSEPPAYSKMRFGAQLFGDQSIGCFLHAIVGKPVGTRRTLDEFLMNGRPQSCVDLILRPPKGD